MVSSKSKAVVTLKNNLEVAVNHLEAMVASNEVPEAKAYHTALTSVQFIKTLHVMVDCLPLISRVTKVLHF